MLHKPVIGCGRADEHVSHDVHVAPRFFVPLVGGGNWSRLLSEHTLQLITSILLSVGLTSMLPVHAASAISKIYPKYKIVYISNNNWNLLIHCKPISLNVSWFLMLPIMGR
jgi:hypothetical protein